MRIKIEFWAKGTLLQAFEKVERARKKKINYLVILPFTSYFLKKFYFPMLNVQAQSVCPDLKDYSVFILWRFCSSTSII